MSLVRPSRRALLAGAAAIAASGCTRFSVRDPESLTEPGDEPRAGVQIVAYENDHDRGEGTVYAYEVETELWLLHDDGARELVHRSRAPNWRRIDLVPGEYEVVVGKVSDGKTASDPDGATKKRFTVAQDQLAVVRLTLKSVPWEALFIVAIVVVVLVVVAAVLAGNAGNGNGLPRPWFPPPPPPLPPPPFLVPPVFVVVWPVDVYGEGWDESDTAPRLPPPPPASGPAIAEVSPPAPDGGVLVRFTEPMRETDFGPDTLQLLGPGGPVAVGVMVETEQHAVRVRPLRRPAPGEWRVRVLGRALRDVDGVALGYDAQVPFTVR